MESSVATMPLANSGLTTTVREETLFSLVVNGDLSRLSPADKMQYYKAMCERVGLDPLTQPYKLMKFQGKEFLYCDRSGTAQLNRLHKISHEIKDRARVEDIYMVTSRATAADGRFSESIGAVSVKGLAGEALANAMMKAETKAKRRSTLDLVGLGIIDETEAETLTADLAADMRPVALNAAPEPLDDEERKAMKKARAQLNKALQEATDGKTFAVARGFFQKEHGKDIWEHKTHHNDRETFMDLVHEHWSRIDNDLRDGEAYAKRKVEFLEQLAECFNPEDFTKLEKEAEANYRLANDSEVMDMVRDKGRDMGFTYAPDFLAEAD